MDNIRLFVDHFIIYSESRKAFILNSGTALAFENSLRDLVNTQMKEILTDRMKHYDNVLRLAEPHKHVSPQYERTKDAYNTLKDLHNDIAFWEEKYLEREEA